MRWMLSTKVPNFCEISLIHEIIKILLININKYFNDLSFGIGIAYYFGKPPGDDFKDLELDGRGGRNLLLDWPPEKEVVKLVF
jgi:hypothetical protein